MKLLSLGAPEISILECKFLHEIQVDGQPVTLLEDIPQGHKFALAHIPAGGAVIKYGAPIGVAVRTGN